MNGASADSDIERGVFVWADTEELDKDVTAFENGYDSTVHRFALGVDAGLPGAWIAGVAVDYSEQEGDFDGGGNFTTTSYGVLAFAAFQPSTPVFLEVHAGWNHSDYERTRLASLTDTSSGGSRSVVSGLLTGEYAGEELRIGAGAGYNFHKERLTIGPHVGVEWVRWEYDGFSERGTTTSSFNNFIPPGSSTGLELNIYDDDQTSLQSNVGLQALMKFNAAAWEIVPLAGISWIHEFENNQRTLSTSFVGDTRSQRFTYQTDSPDRDWGAFDLGVVGTLRNTFRAFANYRTIFGNSMYRNQVVTIGLRVAF